MHPQLTILLGSLHLVLAQDGPTINTPMSVVQCLPTQLTFGGGVPPYTLSALPAGQPGATPLAELGSQSGTSFTWVTNLPGGTATTLQIRDSKGVINYTQAITVQASSDSKCLNGGGGGAGAGTGGTPSPNPSGPPNSTGSGTPGGSTSTTPANPPPKGGNTPGGAQPNATTPATTPNTTSAAAGSTNTTKGPSPFVPPSTTPSSTTPVTTTPNNAASNAPANAASSVSGFSQQSCLAGLAIAAAVSAVFA
ncbi:hypothetical protein PtB15_15B6 [Puccinia triticina]|nr:hypothetical protein PtB15_15B6 [Puccinia triticina]